MDHKEIADDCRAYAVEYNCTIEEAFIDWEGEGPHGSWGLSREDERIVAKLLDIPMDEAGRIGT